MSVAMPMEVTKQSLCYQGSHDFQKRRATCFDLDARPGASRQWREAADLTRALRPFAHSSLLVGQGYANMGTWAGGFEDAREEEQRWCLASAGIVLQTSAAPSRRCEDDVRWLASARCCPLALALALAPALAYALTLAPTLAVPDVPAFGQSVLFPRPPKLPRLI